MQWKKKAEEAAQEIAGTGTAIVEAAKRRIPSDFETARAQLESGGRQLKAVWSREEAIGRAAVGALAFGALAMGAVAVGAFAIGRLSVGKARIGDAEIGRLRIGALEIASLVAPAVAAYPARPKFLRGRD